MEQNEAEDINHNSAAHVAGTPSPHGPSIEAQNRLILGQTMAADVTGFS
jgi:hypothetical protein